MEETTEKKIGSDSYFIAAVNSLLESITDKDESVRISIENALFRMTETRPNKTLPALYEFRQKHPKLVEFQIAIILRIIEKFTISNAHKLNDDSIKKVIDLCISEVTKTTDHCPAIQKPSQEILVAIGRIHCEKVMESLTKQLHQGQVANFMVLNCMGTLATANISGIIIFIKPCLETILPTLGMIKLDHVKQAYAYAVGHFAEAITEHATQKDKQNTDENFQTEIAIAYEVLLHQWLPNREPKVSADILQALSHMYCLLSEEKIIEQSSKIIPQLLGFYRRSMDRNVITQLLASVLKATIDKNPSLLDPFANVLITSLFDLVCVNPDYEKPQTVKGHYEVLRCFDLLLDIFSTKIFDMLLIQLRSNNERDRIKSLLVITHLTNSFDHLVSPKIIDFMPVLKQMLYSEKTLKVKMVLLKNIVALAQKAMITENEFIIFMLRNSCQLNKINPEYGSIEEYTDFVQACNNSLYMLASTVGTMDNILKRNFLQYYLNLDYTDCCNTIAKCLAKLFSKSSDLSFMDLEKNTTEESEKPIAIPSPESVFVRSIVLLGNTNETKRSENILNFLNNYGPILNKQLQLHWNTQIPELLCCIGKEDFLETLLEFFTLTINNVDETTFSESIVHKIADQLVLYPMSPPVSDYSIPNFTKERGTLLKILGLSLCYITDNQTIEAKIDLIINMARQEKIEKNAPNSEYETKLSVACISLGYISRDHLNIVMNKLECLIQDGGSRKSTGNFFSGLTFMKDSHKEADMYKINLLAIEAYEKIVLTAEPNLILKDIDTKIINYLFKQLSETKDHTMKKAILTTMLTIAEQILEANDIEYQLKSRSAILLQIFKIESTSDNLPLFPIILTLATVLIKIQQDDDIRVDDLFEESCRKFFTNAQHLKTKFVSVEDDEKNSVLAKYLNLSLAKLNLLVKAIFEQNSSPSSLDDVNSILEFWIKDKNCEVRICAGHIMNNALEVYIKTVKIGCEAPSKFNQTGSMLARIVPRCIDSNATVRQTSIEILRKILEISCIYESLTIADYNLDWVQDLQRIRDDITTDDPKEIYRLAGEIARIIAIRLSSFQYLQFSKTLLLSLNDLEQSSSIGSSVVLKYFIQFKGSELFHAIPEFVKDTLLAISVCTNQRTKTGALKALVALTKHHPKLMCTEILSQTLPFDENIIEYWQIIAFDSELSGTILDNFISVLASSCLYETVDGTGDRQNIATVHPLAIFCALREILPCKDIQSVLKERFAELFCLLLTSLATYTNLAPPMTVSATKTTNGSQKAKFGFIPNKDSIKMNPCLIVLETFQAFLNNLDMEQLSAVLSVCPHLASSAELNNLMELLTPMAVGLVNQFGINSTYMRQIVAALGKYVSSPYDSQRIAAVGVYSQLIPLKPSGEISSVIMLHLNAALTDPNPLVRGFCIRGLAYVGNLTEHDIDKYSEMSLSALLRGIEDFNNNCFINIPLESMRGLSMILTSLPSDKLETFQVSLSIRIRPFFENQSSDIREAAILLFGNLCKTKVSSSENENKTILPISEALKEQLFTNFFSLLLHLCENDRLIVRACKITLRKVCSLMNAPKLNLMIQSHLLEHGQLHYDVFITDLIKIIGEELNESIPDFIESCLPFLKSSWSEIRGNAAVIIGLLHNLNKTNQHTTENVSHKLSVLLRDDQVLVRIKAANSLGFMFGGLL